MHHHTELSFVDEFLSVSPLHHLKNGWQNAVLLWWMLQTGPPSLHYYCAVVLHSCIVLPPVGHSWNREYHCCQLTRQSTRVSNFYRTFRVFIWLSLVKSQFNCRPKDRWRHNDCYGDHHMFFQKKFMWWWSAFKSMSTNIFKTRFPRKPCMKVTGAHSHKIALFETVQLRSYVAISAFIATVRFCNLFCESV